MVSLTLDLPLLLEPVNNILVLPSDLVTDPLESTEFSSGLQSENSESGGDDHLLHSVLGGGDTLVKLESLEGGSTSGRLVGDHTSDSLVEDSGRSSEMEGTRLLGVNDVSLWGKSRQVKMISMNIIGIQKAKAGGRCRTASITYFEKLKISILLETTPQLFLRLMPSVLL